jgi:ferrous iron transport protein A
MASSSSTARLAVGADAEQDTVAGADPRAGAATVTLGDLRVGERATVLRLSIERPVARRLMELGLLPGTSVDVVRVAPLGDPIEIALRGYRLSIRRSEAARVEVTDRRASDERR